MRLLSLSLKGKYKGLNNQTFNFESSDDNIIAFIGLNGSGKSQLLELIAECFAYLERLQRSDFKNKAHLGFDFSLSYSMAGHVNPAPYGRMEIFGNKINLSEGFDDPTFEVAISAGKVETVTVRQADESLKIDVESLPLPRIVGYSSGLNENLQRAFLKNSNQLFKALISRAKYHKEKRQIQTTYERGSNNSELAYEIYLKNKRNLISKFKRNHPYLFDAESTNYDPNELEVPETTTHPSNLIYLDYDSAQFAVALSDFEKGAIFQDKSEHSRLGSNITFTAPVTLALEFDFTQPHVSDEVVEDVKFFTRLANSGAGSVEYFGKKTSEIDYEYFELDFLRGEIELDLVKLAKESTFSMFGMHNPVKLFERLYKVQQLGVKNIKVSDRRELERNAFWGTVKKPLKVKLPLVAKRLTLKSEKFPEVRYEELSDGESQLLEILAILKLYSQENTLFLLDEPETHLNPAWRTLFHSYLTNALNSKSEKTKSQVLLSTHSPFMVSSLKRDNVYQFRRQDDGTIEINVAQNETYGASFDVLIKDLFELRSLISQSVIDEIRKQLKNGDEQAKEWIEQNLGLSAEKAYLIRKLSK